MVPDQHCAGGGAAGAGALSTTFRVTTRDGRVRFGVHVQPRSSRSGIDGLHGEALRVRVNAPPVDGAANEAVVDVLAKALGVPRRAVNIVAGHASRSKIVEVSGADAARVTALAEA